MIDSQNIHRTVHLVVAKANECKMRRHYYDLMDDKAPLVIVKGVGQLQFALL